MNISIKSAIGELENIEAELLEVRKRNRILRDRKEELQRYVIDYLEERKQPGITIKAKNKILAVTESKGHHRKKKNDIKTDLMYVLKDYGVRDPSSAVDKILKAQQGAEYEKTRLKYKKLR